MNAPLPTARAGIAEASDFIIREARLLDERRFEEWLELFAADGYYWAPARYEQSDPYNEISLIFDDRSMMKNRIDRLRHPKIHAQTPASRAVRQVANFQIEIQDDARGELEVRSTFFMFEHRPTLPDPLSRVFAGEYRHRLQRDGQSFRILWKKALLVNCDATLDALFLYF